MASESNPEPAGAIQPGSDNCYRPTRPVPRRNLYVDADYGGTSKWIAPLCVCSDSNTCCMAHFCPCFLCGKTDWRFERIHKGEDPLNSSWKCFNGFNPVCTACCIVTLTTLLPGRTFISSYPHSLCSLLRTHAFQIETYTKCSTSNCISKISRTPTL